MVWRLLRAVHPKPAVPCLTEKQSYCVAWRLGQRTIIPVAMGHQNGAAMSNSRWCGRSVIVSDIAAGLGFADYWLPLIADKGQPGQRNGGRLTKAADPRAFSPDSNRKVRPVRAWSRRQMAPCTKPSKTVATEWSLPGLKLGKGNS